MARDLPTAFCLDVFSEPIYNTSTDPDKIKINYKSLRIQDTLITSREVRYRLPNGVPPKNGWPVVIIFQGTLAPVEFFRYRSERYGLFYEAKLIEELLLNGFAVLAPDAFNQFAWETNLPPYSKEKSKYEYSIDFYFISKMLEAIKYHQFGSLNFQKLFATGISSGGYMTSRMALEFENQFKAVAIQSASYATCLGGECQIPPRLSRNHPPTLILHGTQDNKVPIETAVAYYETLKRNSIITKFYKNDKKGHEWLPESPDKIIQFFNLENR